MRVEQLQQQLGECFNSSSDANVQAAAQTTNQYTEMFKAGQLQKNEYIQLLSDMHNTNIINKSAENQQVMENINLAIGELISLAMLAG